jgi:fumarylacetoacetase
MNTAQSWLDSANRPDTDFPLANLPFGVFLATASDTPSLGVAIGDQILDLRRAAQGALLNSLPSELAEACQKTSLNMLMSLGRPAVTTLRRQLTLLLGDPAHRAAVEPCLAPQANATMLLPAAIGDYTDFYASIHHATNVGRLFRPDNPLLPNYKYVPIGYHGRASSVVISGTGIRRPSGQLAGPSGEPPRFAPTRLLDYELEVGAFVSLPNRLGEPVPIAQAADHIFGLCLVNDWSARDIQAWEYQPLGPFLAKNFATSISPWVVTLDALEPYRVPVATRPAGDPAPLPYLNSEQDQQRGAFDVTLQVLLLTKSMRADSLAPHVLSRGNLRDLYWTVAQLLAHHTSGGCNLQPGDLFATGTVSGPDPDPAASDSAGAPNPRGCLLEITQRGAHPLRLPNGETRTFLEDGDEIIFRAWCQRPGLPRIGFGECRGRILPAAPTA